MSINDTAERLLAGDAVTAARELVGWTLVTRTPDGVAGGIIVETEAYRAADDPASHAYPRLTPRNGPMFQAGGTLYVYLSYGLHRMLNLVTGPAGDAQAVLIRAIEPTTGLDLMAERRGLAKPLLLARGPARLTQALGTPLTWSGQTLAPYITLTPPAAPPGPGAIAAHTRIGITRGQDLPWRFLLTGSPFVSRPPTRSGLRADSP